MRYIVWRNEFKSYSQKQGDGYFQGYKDKISDKWTKNPIEAKKYKSIGAAITRLNLILSHIKSMDEFWKLNPMSEQYKRSKKMNEILGRDNDKNLSNIFEQGRIEILHDDGSTECANRQAIEYIEKRIEENVRQFENKRSNKMFNTKTIIEHDPNEEFWD